MHLFCHSLIITFISFLPRITINDQQQTAA